MPKSRLKSFKMSAKRFKTTRNLLVSSHQSSGWLSRPSYGASKKKGEGHEDPGSLACGAVAP
ncbi:hypothetical protein ES332_D04G135100v1 [Gossypium tomentosum]|uniref:Uncharacterized protein n=1 Tax=Gossypium tomentosum TaxID=34277 RepID=A0A5D2LCU2_GOSTO|nr:hypothetical protein ES332_D04G135100v1 [Gossypium tomentosum]